MVYKPVFTIRDIFQVFDFSKPTHVGEGRGHFPFMYYNWLTVLSPKIQVGIGIRNLNIQIHVKHAKPFSGVDAPPPPASALDQIELYPFNCQKWFMLFLIIQQQFLQTNNVSNILNAIIWQYDHKKDSIFFVTEINHNVLLNYL